MKTANTKMIKFYTVPFIVICAIGWTGGLFIHWGIFAVAVLLALVYLMVNQVHLTDEIATCEMILEGSFTPKTRQRNKDTSRLLTATSFVAVVGLLTVTKDDWSAYSLILLMVSLYLFVRQALLLDELESLEIKLYGVDDD